MNKKKIIKGLFFIAIAILFLFVKFYNIFGDTSDADLFTDFRYDVISGLDVTRYFKETLLNIAFAILFMVVGILEIEEAI